MTPEAIEILIEDYLDGRLSDEQRLLLERELLADPAVMDRLVAGAALHQLLQNRFASVASDGPHALIDVTDDADDRAVMGMVVDQALAERRKHDMEDDARRKLAAQQAEDARIRQLEMGNQAEPETIQRVIVIPKAVVWVSLAALLGLAVWAIWPKPETLPIQSPTAKQDQPVYVARVNDTYEAVWATRPPGGQFAQGMSATLLNGHAELIFEDGVRVVVQSPAVIEPLGPNALRLVSGRLTAEVPESASGFTVHTPQMLVTDLGTAFGVDVIIADGVTEAFVFDGVIEVSSGASPIDSLDPPVVTVTGGEGVRGEQGRQIKLTSLNPGRFIRQTKTAPYAIQGSDTVCFLEYAPRSLMPGALESNDWVHVMLERTGVRQTQPFAASATQPGQYQSFASDGVDVEFDGLIDSYLVHIDPVGLTEPIVLEGSITFLRPVVAILGDEEQLIQTDRWFARRDTHLYRASGNPFGLDGTENPGILPDAVDMIELSEDRRTIRFRLHALRPFDEFRVLIEAAEVSP